jgi:hypothetical protein
MARLSYCDEAEISKYLKIRAMVIARYPKALIAPSAPKTAKELAHNQRRRPHSGCSARLEETQTGLCAIVLILGDFEDGTVRTIGRARKLT